MVIESQKVTFSKSKEEIAKFASEVANFEKLMPDTVTKFEVTSPTTFKFALQGMPEFELKVIDTTANGVQLVSASEKTPFKLNLDLQSSSDNSSEGLFVFAGDFNPMMAMMIKKPISNFLGVLISKLSAI